MTWFTISTSNMISGMVVSIGIGLFAGLVISWIGRAGWEVKRAFEESLRG